MWIALTAYDSGRKVVLATPSIVLIEEYKYGTTDKGDPIYGSKITFCVGTTFKEICVTEPIDKIIQAQQPATGYYGGIR